MKDWGDVIGMTAMPTTGIAATAIFCLIFAWNEYAFAVLLTSGTAQTAPPFIPTILAVGGGIDWPAVAAGVAAFMAVKALGIYGVARVFGADHREALQRSALFAQGYIGRYSAHSTGTAIDLSFRRADGSGDDLRSGGGGTSRRPRAGRRPDARQGHHGEAGLLSMAERHGQREAVKQQRSVGQSGEHVGVRRVLQLPVSGRVRSTRAPAAP